MNMPINEAFISGKANETLYLFGANQNINSATATKIRNNLEAKTIRYNSHYDFGEAMMAQEMVKAFLRALSKEDCPVG